MEHQIYNCPLFIARATKRGTTFLKNTLWPRCFPVRFTKFLRATFSIEQLLWLLLQFYFFSVKTKRYFKLTVELTK